MLNTIVLSVLVVILVIIFVLDKKSRNREIIMHAQIQQKINIINNTLSSIPSNKSLNVKFEELEESLRRTNSKFAHQHGFRVETITRDLEMTMSTLDSVQEKISELEVSIQNISNQR